MSKIAVLGAGMVGSAMAIDLSQNHEVTVFDANEQALANLLAKQSLLTTKIVDVTDKKLLIEVIQRFDLVVCAVPGFLGFQTLKSIIKAKKDVVDISFFPEDALLLHDLALENGVTAIVDCGVAPGMDNIILGRYNEELTVTNFECLVGGLPKERKWPFCYKAPFSPIDVIEEYTRPARFVENSNVIVREPLTDVELHEFPHVGTLESFNSDGLRSLLFTMSHIPNMKEKTLRYPGHAEYIKVLKASGFFSEKKLLVNGVSISPLEFTSKVLFNEWKLESTDEELTVMRVTIEGLNKKGKNVKIVYDLQDTYDMTTQTSSMARCTGYTATAAVELFLKDLYTVKGISPPEYLGKDEQCFDFILKYLSDRGVNYVKE